MTGIMRKAFYILLLIISTLPAFPQRSADYGVSAGIVNYLGEDNPQNAFFKPGPAAQFFYRYNFNPRQAVRANLMGGYLTPLNAPIGELGATYEFNFFPYSTFRSRNIDYTPYIAAGAAFSFVFNNNAPQSTHPFFSIPFSAGFKINVANQIGLEFEYGFRKTFYDKFDGRNDLMIPGSTTADLNHSWTHNNDWYSFMGVSVTWKMYNRLAGCPAFAEIEQDKLGKRKKR